jgi:hypothetical protein
VNVSNNYEKKENKIEVLNDLDSYDIDYGDELANEYE